MAYSQIKSGNLKGMRIPRIPTELISGSLILNMALSNICERKGDLKKNQLVIVDITVIYIYIVIRLFSEA